MKRYAALTGDSKKYWIKSRYGNKRIAYGRGAYALVRQAKTEGVTVEVHEMQLLIDSFFERFPRVREYINKCHDCVLDPGYVENAYGRRRYFFAADEPGKLKAQQREAQNMPKLCGHVKRSEFRGSHNIAA